MSAGSSGSDLISVVALLGAGVVAVPIFKRVGLGSILGYLAAGLVIGPFGVGFFSDPAAILSVAELGVVMFLFIIGLEMQPRRLWNLRREIFGLGVMQVGLCAALLTATGLLGGFGTAASFVAGAGFVLTSTAIVMQILEERGDMATPKGQRIISILLLEDLAIVPLLALVAFLAPGGGEISMYERLIDIGIGLAAIVALVIAGLYLLNPLFRLLAQAQAREVMTAAALLVVLGAALVMQLSGLSMAMGAFLAGVLLSESTFRHQLEADVEPFRGILLGLFFLAVGMSLDLSVVARNWQLVAAYVVVYMVVKGFGIYAVARFLKSSHSEALERAVIMAQGGEFAFVLYGSAMAVGIIDGEANATLTAIIIISMVLTPLAMIGLKYVLPKNDEVSLDGVDEVDGLTGSVLVIGFGRFGQIASQPLLLRGVDVSIIDNDVEMIQAAATFGFKVYYGDGTRLDILHAAGAGRAEAVLICVDKGETAVKIAEQLKAEFPLTKVLVRAADRGVALDLVHLGVDYQLRETFESALVFGQNALETIGVDEDEAAETIADVRRRDEARFEAQITGGIPAGRGFFKGNIPRAGPAFDAKAAGSGDERWWRAGTGRSTGELSMAVDAQARECLKFWVDAGREAWFEKNDAFDADFRARFLDLHYAAARRELDHWSEHAEGSFALMILLDQFPRNSFRGTGHMYATDPLARHFAQKAIDAGHDREMDAAIRVFFYLPFSHSEHPADQEYAVELNREGTSAEFLEHAIGHRDVVARFGHFPHRNRILGRETTPSEQAFLEDGGFAG